MNARARKGAAVAALLAAFAVGATLPLPHDEVDTTPSVTNEEYFQAEWERCVDAAWEADDPTDATLRACDERFGQREYRRTTNLPNQGGNQ